MRILCIATKPPWPPHDGGRLALATTIEALRDAGHAVRVIAPGLLVAGRGSPAIAPGSMTAGRASPASSAETIVCEATHRGWALAMIDGFRGGTSASLARHRHPRAADCVAQQIAGWKPDIVHVEQLQAFAAARPALAAGLPVVLRMQNVESSLLEQAIALRAMPSMRGPAGPVVRALARIEAARLRRDEADALRQATRMIALSSFDAEELRTRSGKHGGNVDSIALPFPAELRAGSAVDAAHATRAPVAIGGSDWWPNVDGIRWFIDHVQPRLGGLRVDVFGGRPLALAGSEWHPPRDDSSVAFPSGSIMAVPLRAASGIRMRILEAFARGCAVVATTVAARGLDVAGGRELIIADTAGDFASALVQLSADAGLRDRLVTNARAYLRAQHGRSAIESLVDCYAEAIR